nr:SprT family zinc-dependent metalloprotease [Allosphingosinicella vermicomposti]
MRLKVDHRTGGVVLTVPRRVSQARALAWAQSQKDWIARARAAIPDRQPLEPGMQLPFRGRDLVILWDEKAPRIPHLIGDAIHLGGPRDTVEARLLRWLRQEALCILSEETRFYAVKAGVAVTRVGVGDTISRWGSCSSSGAIRYSWRLILAPDSVRRATVAHEVAHRVHMNHGPDFHSLVAKLFEGNSDAARDWLRKHGAGLHRIGR